MWHRGVCKLQRWKRRVLPTRSPFWTNQTAAWWYICICKAQQKIVWTCKSQSAKQEWSWMLQARRQFRCDALSSSYSPCDSTGNRHWPIRGWQMWASVCLQLTRQPAAHSFPLFACGNMNGSSPPAGLASWSYRGIVMPERFEILNWSESERISKPLSLIYRTAAALGF